MFFIEENFKKVELLQTIRATKVTTNVVKTPSVKFEYEREDVLLKKGLIMFLYQDEFSFRPILKLNPSNTDLIFFEVKDYDTTTVGKVTREGV